MSQGCFLSCLIQLMMISLTFHHVLFNVYVCVKNDQSFTAHIQ